MPPYHPVFGHLLVAQEVMSKLSGNAHPQYLPGQVRRKYSDLGPVFYLDMWPFSLPILVAASPLAAYQLTQEHSQPKSEGLRNYMRPMTDNHDLVSMEGQVWKDWRNVYNPVFSASHLITLDPELLYEITTFSEILRELVRKGDMFSLEDVTVNLTMDIIGRVALWVSGKSSY
jgi:sterigmatocystin biosynthesis cytochrome P450 monooxygenase